MHPDASDLQPCNSTHLETSETQAWCETTGPEHPDASWPQSVKIENLFATVIEHEDDVKLMQNSGDNAEQPSSLNVKDSSG